MVTTMGRTLLHKPISILVDIAKYLTPIRTEELKAFLETLIRGKRNYCPVCDRRIWRFDFMPMSQLREWDEHGYIQSIFSAETLNIFSYNCPCCGATDRDRLYALYLKQKISKVNVAQKYSFIDFAPSKALSKALKKCKLLNYRSADLFMDNVDDRVDIADMPIYKDMSINIFLCSHVLEHVKNDGKAIAELYRILSCGGWGIVMVPISLNLSAVYEDPSVKTDSEKWKHFGSYAHYRIYSKQGFTTRLEAVGFRVHQLGIDYFGANVFEKHGIHPRSVLYVVEKPLM